MPTPTATTNDPATNDPGTVAASTFEALARSWNAGDGAAFGDLFAAETDFVDIRGDHHRGDGVAMGHGHQAIFDTIYAGSTVRYDVDVAREVAAGCIVVVATSTLDAPSGPLRGTNRSRITATLTTDGERWLITAFANTLVAAGA